MLSATKRYLATAAAAATNTTTSKAFTNTTSQLGRATLTIKDGPVFNGYSFGANRNVSGEAVFTTSLVDILKV